MTKHGRCRHSDCSGCIRILYSSKEDKKPVTMVANDTDILVLLMFHWEAHMNICMLSHTGKK